MVTRVNGGCCCCCYSKQLVLDNENADDEKDNGYALRFLSNMSQMSGASICRRIFSLIL